jgi:hypothetical protein
MWSDNETAIDLLAFQYLTKAVCGIVKDEHLLPATMRDQPDQTTLSMRNNSDGLIMSAQDVGQSKVNPSD